MLFSSDLQHYVPLKLCRTTAGIRLSKITGKIILEILGEWRRDLTQTFRRKGRIPEQKEAAWQNYEGRPPASKGAPQKKKSSYPYPQVRNIEKDHQDQYC